MKKDLIFAPVLLVVACLLGMLSYTGIAAHIGVSVVGVLALGAYTTLTKKSWKIPALEIIMRASYGIALISGIVIKNVHGIAALSILHKATAALFVVALVALFVQKLILDLRKDGISAERDYLERSVKAQMKYANKLEAKFSAVIGDDDISKNCANVKNMQTGESAEVEFSALSEYLKKHR